MSRMRQPSLAKALEWLALNDNPECMVKEDAQTISACMVADVWNKPIEYIAGQVVGIRYAMGMNRTMGCCEGHVGGNE